MDRRDGSSLFPERLSDHRGDLTSMGMLNHAAVNEPAIGLFATLGFGQPGYHLVDHFVQTGAIF
ncbi:MAG TPA: hypothetical protein PKE45_09625, partial [Caldilineaceae bacterium]|nr:hypothetical protein [Caldilineaceae bacterium]